MGKKFDIGYKYESKDFLGEIEIYGYNSDYDKYSIMYLHVSGNKHYDKISSEDLEFGFISGKFKTAYNNEK